MLPKATIDAANAEIMRVFETTSVMWRTIPHWDTGDSMMSMVPGDAVNVADPKPDTPLDPLADSAMVPIARFSQRFVIDPAVAADGTDGVLAAVGAVARLVAAEVDAALVDELRKAGTSTRAAKATEFKDDEFGLFSETVRSLQDAGYRGPRAVYATTAWFDKMNGAITSSGKSLRDAAQHILDIASLDHTPASATGEKTTIILGRSGNADGSAAGHEPVDLAVSIMPSLEYLGVDSGKLLLAVRLACALRVKDVKALVEWAEPEDPKSPDSKGTSS